MPQLGLHLMIGAAGYRKLHTRSRWFAAGVVAGSVAPDLDFLLVVPIRFVSRELALSLHRSFSHSLLLIAAILVAALISDRLSVDSSRRGSDGARIVGPALAGIAAGIAVHTCLDLIFWFDSVRILWPLPMDVYLYGSFAPPGLLRNIMSALEIACYGVFLWAVADITRRPRVARRIAGLMALGGIPLLVFSPTVPEKTFEMISYGVAICLGFIPVVVITGPAFIRRLRTQEERNNVVTTEPAS